MVAVPSLDTSIVEVGSEEHPDKNVRTAKSGDKDALREKEILQKESHLILSKISEKDYIISWDKRGQNINSEDFSAFFAKSIETKKEIIFIVGGSFGLSEDILNKSNLILSASLLTFPHRLFRLILMEQIYRAYTIINKKPYHK